MKCDPQIESTVTGPSAQADSRETLLPMPEMMHQQAPLSPAARATVARGRREIADILSGRDSSRLLLVCGPCSIDDVNAAMAYAQKLRALAKRVEDRALVVMRTYFEKPRSVLGWKGLLYDPMQSESSAACSGIALARRLLARVNAIGLPCATEFLSPMLSLYIEDGISYGSIGSRTVESQIHRELASRLPLPMGLKNGMDGNPASAVNGAQAAAAAHRVFDVNARGRPCLLEVEGNPMAHVILRGGSSGPNFAEAVVAQTVGAARRPGLRRPVVIDCSHGNSQKNHLRQEAVAQEALRQFRHGETGIAGLMLESYLLEGRQEVEPGAQKRFGQSITDSCIDWDTTERIVLEVASGR